MRRCSGILVASFLKTANVYDEFGVTEEVSATFVISIYVTQVEVLALCMGFLYTCVCFYPRWYVCIYTSVYIYTCLFINTNTCVCVCLYICVCMFLMHVLQLYPTFFRLTCVVVLPAHGGTQIGCASPVREWEGQSSSRWSRHFFSFRIDLLACLALPSAMHSLWSFLGFACRFQWPNA